MAEGIQLESYGGDIPAVYVSGLTGQGLPDLVETLAALAEMQDLRAEQSGFAFGEILESKVQRGLGLVLDSCTYLPVTNLPPVCTDSLQQPSFRKGP